MSVTVFPQRRPASPLVPEGETPTESTADGCLDGKRSVLVAWPCEWERPSQTDCQKGPQSRQLQRVYTDLTSFLRVRCSEARRHAQLDDSLLRTVTLLNTSSHANPLCGYRRPGFKFLRAGSSNALIAGELEGQAR